MSTTAVTGESASSDQACRGRILLVTPQPFYEDRGTPIAVELVARALSELGYRIDILAFPFGSTPEIPGVAIHRIGNPYGIDGVPIGFSWRKAFLDAPLLFRMRRLMSTHRYDAIHAVEEAAYLVLLLGRPTAPVLYDMASSIPDHLSGRPWVRLTGLRGPIRRLEARVLQKADFVMCSSGLESRMPDLMAKGRAAAWQFPTPSDTPSAADIGRLRHVLRIAADAPVILYSGSFAAYQGLAVLIDAAPAILAERPDAVFVCVGAVANEKDRLLRSLDPGLGRAFRIVERRPRDEMPAYLAMADILVSTRQTGDNTPLKVYEYLATGKPVLASRGAAHEPISGHPQVRLFDHNGDDLAACVLHTLRHSGNKPRNEAPPPSLPSWEAFKQQLAAVYETLLGKPA